MAGADAELHTAYTESEGASMVTCHMKTFDSFGSVTLVPGTGLLVAWPSSCAGCQSSVLRNADPKLCESCTSLVDVRS